MANKSLGAAKNAKNDEFYTQFSDIQEEIEAYLEFDPDAFRGKVVYSNCDDPFESNFFRYFALNFNRLGLKQLITTSYKPSPIANSQLGLFGDDKTIKPEKGRPKVTANKFIINEVHDMDGDGAFNISDIAEQLKANKNNEWTPLKGDGDFRSDECIELLKQSDIVVTNPPFSLFVEFIQQLVEHNKKFIVIGNMNAITYKDIFPLIKSDKLWLGNGFHAGNAYFSTPNAREDFASGVYDEKTGLVKFRNVHWFTNMDHGRRHRSLSLMTMEDNKKFNKKLTRKQAYDTYDNYDAIEVPFTDAIPSDYKGIMGVPISFLDKYNPDQFEILGMCENEDLYNLKTKKYSNQEKKDAYFAKFGKSGQYDLNASGVVLRDGLYEKVYQRVLIKHRKVTK
ncbi:adenine-specific methyltransferase EcoRI family protein [Candidatus Saccharibacteria bacterium]|nr:adenine-specific methyltransferase EcoRI family protein [Candidatus Saccharibacteria bacterium]MBI3338341.1 adenine-specific methyltransferase EcoRI family protein [Candidatus Saccharibacteria bacterium]